MGKLSGFLTETALVVDQPAESSDVRQVLLIARPDALVAAASVTEDCDFASVICFSDKEYTLLGEGASAGIEAGAINFPSGADYHLVDITGNLWTEDNGNPIEIAAADITIVRGIEIGDAAVVVLDPASGLNLVSATPAVNETYVPFKSLVHVEHPGGSSAITINGQTSIEYVCYLRVRSYKRNWLVTGTLA